MRKTFFLIVFILSTAGVIAQQDPQFSQNMFNTLTINPAFAGIKNNIFVSAINRQQWIGFDNAPVTTVFNIDAPVNFPKTQHGVGLTIISDKLGIEKNNNIRFNYSFHKKLKTGKLNFGVYFGLQNNASKGTWFIPDGDGFTAPGGDPLLGDSQIDESHMVFDSGFGLLYQYQKVYLGLSITHLNQPKIQYGENVQIFLARHYYFTGGYTFKITDPIEIIPSFFYKTDGKIAQIDINTNLLYNKKFLGGVSYRINDAFVSMIGIRLRQGLQIGYAYDFSTSRISRGSHEFLMAYNFDARLDFLKQKYKSIRFL